MQIARKTAAKPTILLLEDDLLLAMDMEDFLDDRGYRIAGPYGRVDQALEAAESMHLDGAVVDLNLHGETSLPVIDLLRQRGVPVIVCSGYAELPELKQKLTGLPLLAKPWNPQKLDLLLNDVFEAVAK
ncbi:response regulator [Neorhizobium sp. JUb45]|uniref:response regulator n=1 Tax=unclassified Neorhizobium TaxID=2629175 RepID=UPI0010EDFD3B|nr:response regulator [Neorhizobium sp. JUb45]TCR03208.1 response regulator receiver domain-containing protein [Neorhizobium sp. JUb45]